MEMRDLLEKMMKFAGEKVGQKPGDQWRGTDKAPPGKKLVGDSILKDLSKGPTAKSKEQELAEEFQAFLEAEFKDTVEKRPGRKNARPARGHEPEPRYKTIKADESAMSEKDIELQDYRTMSHKEFQTAYKMTKTEWINKNKALVIQNPSIKKALGLEEAEGQEYTVVIDRKGRQRPVTGTIPELLDYFGYTLEVGKSYEHERGRYKINMNPKNVVQLVDTLNKAKSNAAANGHSDTYYSVGEQHVAEGVPYKATNPHPASKDPVVAKVLKQMRPGLTGLEMNNEAFLYFAYELGKDRARGMWDEYGPAIKHFYQSGIGVNEGWESGPPEYKEPYDDADDAYERQRQEKIDTEAEKEWAKLPKVSTYKLLGRGPNMEPNYEFDGKEYDTLEAAIEARGRLMADPETPYPEHIGIQTLTRVVDKKQTNEAVYTAPKNREEYDAKMAALQDLQNDPNTANDPELQKKIIIYMDNLQKVAHQHGWLSQPLESRGHKIIATKLKDIERAKRFASGELNIPTPQERQAQLKKLEKAKPVKEYGASNVTPYGQSTAPKVDPKQAQQVAANLNVQKTALNQLKQMNPEIDPAKAAAAMTKDTATMSPQEKDELAQVAKTLSPALGTPAFGSLKTAIQKSQIK